MVLRNMRIDMEPERIVAAIHERGETLKGLSLKSGFSASAVSVALKTRSPFVQQAIADFIGLRAQDIWPSRYDENGSPVRLDPRGRRASHHPIGSHRQQKGKAA